MISRPIPPARPVEISATTTPTTEAVAASFRAGTMYGSAAGNLQLEQRLAPGRRVRVHELERRGWRRRQPLQRADRHGEEGEERAEHGRREPSRPLERADVEPAAPAHDERRECDQRHGLRQDEVREEPPFDDLVPRHEHGEPEPDRGSERETGECDPEGEPGSPQHDHQDRRVGRAVLGLPVAREHLPHVGHRGVVRAGQDRPAEHGPAVLGTDDLVELPHGGHQDQRERERPDPPEPRQVFARTVSAMAGMTFSP